MLTLLFNTIVISRPFFFRGNKIHRRGEVGIVQVVTIVTLTLEEGTLLLLSNEGERVMTDDEEAPADRGVPANA
jgi:hypothetical protein